MIGIYNKGDITINGTFIQNVRKYTESETKVCVKLHELQACEIAIVHIFDEEWGSLIKDYSGHIVGCEFECLPAGFSDKPPPTIRGPIMRIRFTLCHLLTVWKRQNGKRYFVVFLIRRP